MHIKAKPTVFCFKDAFSFIKVGTSAEGIVPINHPDSYLNGILIITSTVLDADPNGHEFWTKNTHYVVVSRISNQYSSEYDEEM